MFRVDGKLILPLGKDNTSDQPHQVDRIGHLRDLIEIVDAPNEPALEVTPSSEILYVQISYRE